MPIAKLELTDEIHLFTVRLGGALPSTLCVLL
jgi:hypothetical protein